MNPSLAAAFTDRRDPRKDKCHASTRHVFGPCWLLLRKQFASSLIPWRLTGTNEQMTSLKVCVLAIRNRLSPQLNLSSSTPPLSVQPATWWTSLSPKSRKSLPPCPPYIPNKLPNKLWCRCQKKAHISSNQIKANRYQKTVLLATIFYTNKMRRPTTYVMKRRDELHVEPAGISPPLFALFGSALILLQLEQNQMSATKYIMEEVTVLFLSYSAS